MSKESEHFSRSLDQLIEGLRQESDLTVAEMVGILNVTAYRLMIDATVANLSDALDDETEEPE